VRWGYDDLLERNATFYAFEQVFSNVFVGFGFLIFQCVRLSGAWSYDNTFYFPGGEGEKNGRAYLFFLKLSLSSFLARVLVVFKVSTLAGSLSYVALH
jgi:hypothetical protein